MREGIQGLTMDRVAAEAGVAKGTLYVYFKNKDEILNAAVEMSIEPLLKGLKSLLDSDIAPDRKLEEFSLFHLRFFDENKNLIRILFFDRERVYFEKNHYTDERYRFSVKQITGVLDQGIKQGFFIPIDSVKVAAMFIEANMGMVMQRIYDGISGDLEKDAKQVTGIFMNGLKKKNKNR
jgi:AcrR family transcriptional regulator